MVNPDDPSIAHVKTLYDLIDDLETTLGCMSCCVYHIIHSALRYENGLTLRGAPYDFRLVGDRCYTESYFSILKGLVEDTVKQNDGRRVRFVCHSLGCMLGCAMG